MRRTIERQRETKGATEEKKLNEILNFSSALRYGVGVCVCVWWWQALPLRSTEHFCVVRVHGFLLGIISIRNQSLSCATHFDEYIFHARQNQNIQL